MRGMTTNMYCDRCEDITEHILEDYKQGVETWLCKCCDEPTLIGNNR